MRHDTLANRWQPFARRFQTTMITTNVIFVPEIWVSSEDADLFICGRHKDLVIVNSVQFKRHRLPCVQAAWLPFRQMMVIVMVILRLFLNQEHTCISCLWSGEYCAYGDNPKHRFSSNKSYCHQGKINSQTTIDEIQRKAIRRALHEHNLKVVREYNGKWHKNLDDIEKNLTKLTANEQDAKEYVHEFDKIVAKYFWR